MTEMFFKNHEQSVFLSYSGRDVDPSELADPKSKS